MEMKRLANDDVYGKVVRTAWRCESTKFLEGHRISRRLREAMPMNRRDDVLSAGKLNVDVALHGDLLIC